MSGFDGRPDGPDSETLVRRVVDLVSSTRPLPLSSSVKLDNRDEVLELLEEALQRLPDELRRARWMLKEREEYLEKTRREAEDIVEAARLRAERMVQRTEIVRQASHTARKVVEDARDEARRLRLEAEDYADQKLATFEVVLERTMRTVQAGREKLSATASPPMPPAAVVVAGGEEGDETLAGNEAFFDQDLT